MTCATWLSIAAGAINDLLAENLDNLEFVLRQRVEIGSIRRIVLADAQQQPLLQIDRLPNGHSRIDYRATRTRLAIEPREQLTADSYRFITPIGIKEQVGWVEITAGLEAARPRSPYLARRPHHQPAHSLVYRFDLALRVAASE